MLNKEFYKYVPSYFLPLLNFVEKRYSHESWFETEFNKYADLIMHTPKKKMVAPSVYFADIAEKYKKNDIPKPMHQSIKECSDQIVDMTIAGASDEELSEAIKDSIDVIDAANDISENNDEAPDLNDATKESIDIHNIEPIQKTSLNENVNNYRKNEKQNYSNYYNKNSYKNKK